MKKYKHIILDNYKFTFPLLIIIISHFFSFPKYSSLKSDRKVCSTCCDMQKKIDRRNHLLESVSSQFLDADHMAKTEFRLTVPFIAKIFQIDTKYKMYFFQVILGFLFFYFLTSFIFNYTQDKTNTFLFLLSFAFIYTGYSFFTDTEGYFDSFAYFFLFIAMLELPILAITIAFFLAFFTDERAILSGILVVLYGQYKTYIQSNKNYFKFSKQLWGFFISILFYLTARWILMNYFGFKNHFGGVGFKLYKITFNYFGISFFQIFEGFWLIISLSLFILKKTKEIYWIIAFIIVNLGYFLMSLTVADITRSGAYIFPSIFLSFLIVKNYATKEQLRYLLYFTTIISFVYPSYFIIAAIEPKSFPPFIIHVIKNIAFSIMAI